MSGEGALWFFVFGLVAPIVMTADLVMHVGAIGLLCLLLIPAMWFLSMSIFGIWR